MAYDQTQFTVDLIGRFVCNTWDEAINQGGAPYDVVVIGAGMHGGYCAEKIFRFAKQSGRTLRILVLDAGSLLLSQHQQNYPKINPKPGVMNVVTSNFNDPGVQEAVWGYPWRSSTAFPGLAYCFGGRSIYWGGWAPRLTNDELADWPTEVRTQLLSDYPTIEEEIGITALQDEPLSTPLMTAFQVAVAGTNLLVEPAPLAVQSIAPTGGLFGFDKYSSANLLISAIREDAEADSDPKNRKILIVPRTNVTFLQNNGRAVTGMEVYVNGQRQIISTNRELKHNFKIVVATSTIESTRLALNSFPVNGMGANLTAHLRSNLSVRIPRSALGLGAATQLETGMILVRGSVAVSGGLTRHFHIQVLAASNLDGAPDGLVFSQIPDIDLRHQLTQAQSPSEIRLVFRSVGELTCDRSMTPPDGPKDIAKSWVDLTKDSGNIEFENCRRAWVNLIMNADDLLVRQAMNATAMSLANKISNNAAIVESQVDDAPGSTHHEAGTLWLGTPGNSITNQDGRFHHIDNAYVAGPALFPRAGSANPTLTALALARNTANVITNTF